MAPIKNIKIHVSPNIRTEYGSANVSVYRAGNGDIYIRQKGAKLTPAERKKGLSRAYGKTAQSLRDFYSNPEHLAYKINFTKETTGIKKTRYLRPATIDGRAGWFDTRNGKFIFKEVRSSTPNAYGENWKQYGTTQLNLRSCDNTAYGLMQRGSLEEFYLEFLNANEKARLTEALTEIDWEREVYSHFESSDPDAIAPAGRPNPDEEKKGYDRVLRVIKQTVGVKWSQYLALVGA